MISNYMEAQEAADMALQLDYTLIKARYRRAMALRGLNHNTHSIVDLSTVLVLDPKNAAARSNLIQGLKVHVDSKLRAISTGDLLEVEDPPAPRHKKICSVFAEHGVLIELSAKINRHIHMRELMRAYAIVVLGLLGDNPFPVPMVVVFQVELFPIPKSSQRRLGIRRIQVMVAENPDICLLRCMVSPNIGRAPDNYISYDVAAVFRNEIHRMKQCGIEEVNSPIFGPHPLKMDLENIFRAVEDELEGDVHNFYRLRE
ncbi:hypothetical protein C8J57DRAFT_1724362 [Mycena rebaudengoi]|nr:hypothetical protein C8J57DRAFT_1724362 [Mycena rebaudengoi]